MHIGVRLDTRFQVSSDTEAAFADRKDHRATQRDFHRIGIRCRVRHEMGSRNHPIQGARTIDCDSQDRAVGHDSYATGSIKMLP
jgi:hypothetical protein